MAVRALDDLAERLGLRRRSGGYARGPCILCGSKDGAWATVTTEGLPRVGCWSCDDWRALRKHAGLRGGKERILPQFRRPKRTTDKRPVLDMVEDATVLDAVYRVIAKHLHMTTDRRRTILGRDRRIPKCVRDRMPLLVAAMPSDPRERQRVSEAIRDDLRRVAPIEILRQVPELAARRGDSLAIYLTKGAKYLEPWTDERGRIVALRAYMGKRASPKYKTAYGRSGALIHVAFGVPPDEVGTAPWIFTEGWIKAEVVAHSLGAVVVALPGVSSRVAWARAIEAKGAIAPSASSFIAFDSEVWSTRPDIAAHALSLAAEVRHAEGRTPGFAAWECSIVHGKSQPKGIDDAIVANVPVHLLDREAFAAHLGPALARWEADPGD